MGSVTGRILFPSNSHAEVFNHPLLHSVTVFGERFFKEVRAKSLQLYLTLCDHMDCSPSGSSVHGILQARMLEWVVMPSWGVF